MPYRVLLLLLLWLPVQADPLGVLVVDGKGRWVYEEQGAWRPDLGEQVVTEWRELLVPEAVASLSFAERCALLSWPERLLTSDRATAVFATSKLLLLKPYQQERIDAVLVNLASGARRRLSLRGRRADEIRRKLVATTAIPPESIVFNPGSKLYHKETAPHLAQRAELQLLDSEEAALDQQGRPCPICFPERNRSLFYDDLDRRLGRYVATLIQSRYPLSDDASYTGRVEQIGERLLRSNHYQDQGYKFLVLDTSDVNAFAAPTGPFYITTGLLNVLETDDEVACVLGHELSHSRRRHARLQFEQSQRAGILGVLVTVATGTPWARLGTDFMNILFASGYSRGFELEADRDGLFTAYGAGFEVSDFVIVQTKLLELEQQRGGGGPGWLRSHPGGEERIEQLEILLDLIAPLDALVKEIEPTDPRLAAFLRTHAREYLDDPEETKSFLRAYHKLPVPSRIDPSFVDDWADVL